MIRLVSQATAGKKLKTSKASSARLRIEYKVVAALLIFDQILTNKCTQI